MPKVETYSVNFGSGNLHPHVNLYGWPDMALSQQVPGVTQNSVNGGLVLSYTRTGPAAPGTPQGNSIYVIPPSDPSPSALPINTRLFMRLKFDLPYAESLAGTASEPEPWAVSLNVRLDGAIDSASPKQVNLTCQFARSVQGFTVNGARLNTPMSLQQADQASALDSPLNYAAYREKLLGLIPPAMFTLDHAFCGFGARPAPDGNGHTPGSGALGIRLGWGPEKEDQRVYSSDKLSPSAATTTIAALGVTLTSQSGLGTCRVRLRSFQLWLHQHL